MSELKRKFRQNYKTILKNYKNTASEFKHRISFMAFAQYSLTGLLLWSIPPPKQETQLSLTNSTTRLEVSQGQQTIRCVWFPYI